MLATQVVPAHLILAEIERARRAAPTPVLRLVPPPPPPDAYEVEEVDDADIVEVVPHPAPAPAPKARKPRAPRKPKAAAPAEPKPKAPRKPRASKAAVPPWQQECRPTAKWRGKAALVRDFAKVEGSLPAGGRRVPPSLKAWLATPEWKGSEVSYRDVDGRTSVVLRHPSGTEVRLLVSALEG